MYENSFLQKIRFYKRLLLFLYLLCSVSLVGLVGLNFQYFLIKKNLVLSIDKYNENIEKALESSDTRSALQDVRSYRDKLSDYESQMKSFFYETLVYSFCIIIFGVIIPFIVSYFIKKKIEEWIFKFQEDTKKWVANLMSTYQQGGREPFQNVDFWLKISLLTIESASKYSSHPVAFFAGQTAQIIRSEIHKKK